MSALLKRKLLDAGISICCYLLLSEIAGAGLWAMLIVPLSLWNYYDGKTRHLLPPNV